MGADVICWPHIMVVAHFRAFLARLRMDVLNRGLPQPEYENVVAF